MNFNNKNIKNEKLSKENILKYISEHDVYSHYVQGIEEGTVVSSPFRKDEEPSFGIFIGSSGDLAFNDFKIGGGDFVKFVSLMEHCDYKSALSVINNIFSIGLVDFVNFKSNSINKKGVINKFVPKKKKKAKINIKIREWSQRDIDYWFPLDIKKLKDIYPIQCFWVNSELIICQNIAYAYRYADNVYKIYQPLAKTNRAKWCSNVSAKVEWFGKNHLPIEGDLLFIASSNKDALVLTQAGYSAIAPHSEAQSFTQAQFDYYDSKFKRIVIFYDNDETGILKATKFANAFDLTYIALEEEDTKDPFEFVKKYDLNTLKDYIDERIY